MALNLKEIDILTGSETGFLKGCCVKKKSPFNINKIEKPSKELTINALSWANHERTAVLSGCKYGSVYCYNLESSSCSQLHEDEASEKKPILRAMKYSSKDMFTTLAFNNGRIKTTKFQHDILNFSDYDGSKTTTVEEFDAGQDLYCIDQSPTNSIHIASGGKKNPLKIWDVSKPGEPPIFSAKNVKNDWLNLHVPIWVTKSQFTADGKRIITASGYAEIRLYDPLSSQRRPVLELKYEENPITAMTIRQNNDNHVVVGNTIGNIALLDIRNSKTIVKGFKGARGGVTDIQYHQSKDVFASCGVDRFVNLYEPSKKSPICSIYMHSSLNCLIFSSNWSENNDSDDEKEIELDSGIEGNTGDENDAAEDEKAEDESLWNSMDVVKTKKRKSDSSKKEKAKKNKTE